MDANIRSLIDAQVHGAKSAIGVARSAAEMRGERIGAAVGNAATTVVQGAGNGVVVGYRATRDFAAGLVRGWMSSGKD